MSVSVFDVAAYILKKHGTMTSMKLQKLVFYAQAWHIVWEDKPLFRTKIQCWGSGPVVYTLYKALHGKFKVKASDIKGDPNKLNQSQKETVNEILRFYGDHTAQWLGDLIRLEGAWRQTRDRNKGGVYDARNAEEITYADMHEHYLAISLLPEYHEGNPLRPRRHKCKSKPTPNSNKKSAETSNSHAPV